MKRALFSRMIRTAVADVPSSYRTTVRWLPKIGDFVPNFRAETTMGPLTFHPWAEGQWTVLFSHPKAYTPVCTTEVASLAALHGEFRRRGVQILGLCASSLEEQLTWHHEIAQIFGHSVRFPMISDVDGELAQLMGMVHGKEHEDWPIRKTLIIDPGLKVRAISEYPMVVGRSSEETLRLIDALQRVTAFRVVTGADWEKGDRVMLHPGVDAPPALFARQVRPYLVACDDPMGS